MTETVYARPFIATPKMHLAVSLVVGIYVNLSIWGIYTASRYWLLGDTSTLSAEFAGWLVLGILLYTTMSYRIMLSYDGMRGSGGAWVMKTAEATLPETRTHRRFG